MRLITFTCIIIIYFIIISCKTTSTALRDISKGVREVDNTVRRIDNTANTIKNSKRNSNRQHEQSRGGGNEDEGRNSSWMDRRGEERSKRGEFTPICLSGDCNNGFGKLQISKAGAYYEGDFKNGKYDGRGKIYARKYTLLENDPSMVYLFYDGPFSEGQKKGKGVIYTLDKREFRGEFNGDYVNGLFTMTKDGLTVLNYYGADLETQAFKSLDFPQLKYHQDTVFAKLKRCDCLTKQKFSIPSWGLVNVKYDVINTYTGKKVDEKSELDVGRVEDLQVDGWINNTNHDVYIRCYRKEYYKKRNVYEYIDDSYVVKPGQKIMTNYRIQPQPGELYNLYFEDDFKYLGAFCKKGVTDGCKTLSNPVRKAAPVTNRRAVGNAPGTVKKK